MRYTFGFRILITVTVLVLFPALPGTAAAKQTSLDSRIFQTFEEIDGRTNAHEQDVVQMRARLDALSEQLEQMRIQLAKSPPPGDDPEANRERRVLHSQMINLSAEYLNQAFRLVNSAATVISANLSDLAALANEVRGSEDYKKGATRLQERIKQNIAAGRSMRNALVQMKNWVQQDQSLATKFQGLRRITAAIDRRISVDKARLSGRNIDATGMIRSKRLEALDQTVDQLGDMYAEVMAEKDSLRDLRDEVAMAIQLGRLEMTREVAERAIPRVDASTALSTGVESLQDMAHVIIELNDSLLVEANSPPAKIRRPGSSSPPGVLDVGDFSNF